MVLHIADAVGSVIVAVGIEICFVVPTLLLEIVEVHVRSSDYSAGMTRSFGGVEDTGAETYSDTVRWFEEKASR